MGEYIAHPYQCKYIQALANKYTNFIFGGFYIMTEETKDKVSYKKYVGYKFYKVIYKLEEKFYE